jgi:hypothetical protein
VVHVDGLEHRLAALRRTMRERRGGEHRSMQLPDKERTGPGGRATALRAAVDAARSDHADRRAANRLNDARDKLSCLWARRTLRKDLRWRAFGSNVCSLDENFHSPIGGLCIFARSEVQRAAFAECDDCDSIALDANTK